MFISKKVMGLVLVGCLVSSSFAPPKKSQKPTPAQKAAKAAQKLAFQEALAKKRAEAAEFIPAAHEMVLPEGFDRRLLDSKYFKEGLAILHGTDAVKPLREGRESKYSVAHLRALRDSADDRELDYLKRLAEAHESEAKHRLQMSFDDYRNDAHVQQQMRAGKSCFKIYVKDLKIVFGDSYTKAERHELATILHGAVRPGHGTTDSAEEYVD